ncbi:hypothetical protein [Gottfriedia acidiceleris]|uniref:hypothetical protein n=1 Tax=Gottfriedia acidiceleris TaxID=371036 RepID=UPI003D23EF51
MSDHNNDILTTGPMKIPGRVTGDTTPLPPDIMRVSIKNPTTRDFRIQLFAEICHVDPVTGVGSGEEIFPDDEFIIPANNCRNRTFPFLLAGANVGDILRFFVKGDLDEEAEKLELSFVGQRRSDQMNEPTMFFRHSDLIEVENRHIHQNNQDPDNALASTNFWEN